MNKIVKKIKNKYEIKANQKVFEHVIETVGYAIRDNCIVAMSFGKSEAIKKLKNLSLPITEHLMKILVMPKSSYVPHWKTELKNWQNTLRRYNNGKTKSGINYSMKSLMTHIWENPLSTTADQTTLLKILSDSGYAVPKTLSQNQINKLKKTVETYTAGVLK